MSENRVDPASKSPPTPRRPGFLASLARHTSNYSIGTLLVTLASIVSFSFFTRIFSVADYGTLGLVSSTIGFLVGVGKFGVQHAVVRFYAEVDSGARKVDRNVFFSTVLFGMAGLGAVATLLSAAGALIIPGAWWGGTGMEYLLALASPLVLIRVLDSGLLNLLRSQQRSGFYSLYTVSRKYLGLAVILLALFLFARNLESFFVATMVTESLAVLILIAYYTHSQPITLRQFSWPLLTAMIVFGLPLLASELSGILLNIGARFIINAKMGPESLGAYSAAFNFSEYVQAILTGAFAQAVVPMYFKTWEQQGRAATTEFLQQSLRYYIAVSVAVLAGMAAIGPEMLRLLASDRYDAGGALIPFVVAGMLISGGTPIFSAGVYIKKQTKVVMYSVLAAAIANLTLTALLLDSYGLAGAAFAVLVSYVLFSASTAYFGRHTIKIKMPWLDLLKFSALAYTMYLLVGTIHAKNLVLQLLLQIPVGVLSFGGLLLLSDKPIRDLARQLFGRLRAKFAQPR